MPFRSGELYRWLQRCWWRAIQLGLTITVVDERGGSQTVVVPAWWESEPWRGRKPRARRYENIRVGDRLTIKRIVLLYDESLSEAGIEDGPSQFHGVQLIRGQQWIETLATATLECIPRDKRLGFRGFAEFDQGTERELRHAENTQHEQFDRRRSGVKALIAAIEDKVKEFAEEQGWGVQESTRPTSGAERNTALEFLWFLAPHARSAAKNVRSTANSLQMRMDLDDAGREWTCDLHMDLPNPQSTRVNWGDYIRNVRAVVNSRPVTVSQYATVSLELVHVDSSAGRTAVASQEVGLRNGEGTARFGDFQIITGTPTTGKIAMRTARKMETHCTGQVSLRLQVARAGADHIRERGSAPDPGSKDYDVVHFL